MMKGFLELVDGFLLNYEDLRTCEAHPRCLEVIAWL